MTNAEVNTAVSRTLPGILYPWARGLMTLAFFVSCVVAGHLVLNLLYLRTAVPGEGTAVPAFLGTLGDRAEDAALRKGISELDLYGRNMHAVYRQRIAGSGRLLLAGLAMMILSAAVLAVFDRRLNASPAGDVTSAGLPLVRTGSGWLIPASGASLIILAVVAFYARPYARPALAAAAETPAGGLLEIVPDAVPAVIPVPSDIPSPQEISANWPRFRGPGGLGVAGPGTYPLTWNADTGEGIAWKSPVPLRGESSPVVWNERIFLTGATSETHAVYCFDAADGRMVWEQSFAGTPAGDGIKVWDGNTYAPATAVTDGRRVCAMFANGDLIALDMTGRVLWQQFLGPLQNSYGHAASLDIYQGRLIILLDQKTAADGSPRSKLLALDAATGRPVWEALRPVNDSWSTPIIINAAGLNQIVTASNPWVMGHDADSGRELWRAACLSGDIAPSPAYGGGLVLAAMESVGLTAIRPDGTGDVTATHAAWQVDNGDFPSICSPAADDRFVFLAISGGYLVCRDITDGSLVWEQDLEVSIVSSPVLQGGYVYIMGEEGDGIVCKAAAVYEEVSRSQIGERCQASPAFAAGRIYVRGESHLFCVGR